MNNEKTLCLYYNSYDLAYFNQMYIEIQEDVKKVTLQKFFDKYRLLIKYK